jgi:16S rRNA (cytosine967-C5)-methyltransferase
MLDRILSGDLLDHVFNDDMAFKKFNPLDRALIRMIVTTTLRHLGQINALIDMAMNGSLPKPDRLHTLLRIAIAQLVFMNTPDHAVVNISVDLAERVDLARQKGLINAVLRRLTREDLTDIKNDLSLNFPDWMMQNWAQTYGPENAANIMAHSLTEAPLDITIADKTQTDHWAAQLGGVVLPTGTIRIHNAAGRIEELPGFTDGAWWVQDASAALPIKLLGDISGKHILDLCAAPGGKAAQAATLGAYVIAVDKSPARLEILRQNLARLKLQDRVGVVKGDAANLHLPEPVDIILLDAPCTATGTIRRHPDLLRHRDAGDVARLGALQRQMLDHATTLLKPGGLLVYATCSLQRDEGEDQITAFLNRRPAFQTVPATMDQIGHLPDLITPEGWVRVLPTHLPDQGGMDGFFTALLRFQG